MSRNKKDNLNDILARYEREDGVKFSWFDKLKFRLQFIIYDIEYMINKRRYTGKNTFKEKYGND